MIRAPGTGPQPTPRKDLLTPWKHRIRESTGVCPEENVNPTTKTRLVVSKRAGCIEGSCRKGPGSEGGEEAREGEVIGGAGGEGGGAHVMLSTTENFKKNKNKNKKRKAFEMQNKQKKELKTRRWTGIPWDTGEQTNPTGS